ncbi:MAG: GNAT family N-acetyltransferase [Gemmatimonadota bacterium]|nr:GNAT family N-acetyltransferase [Gemmatimonadota bacterium]
MPSSLPDIRVRRATLADVPALARHRVGMYRDMGDIPDSEEAQLFTASAAYFRVAVASGEYLAWLAFPSTSPNEVVAGAGLIVRAMIPRPGPTGMIEEREAQVVNVYTEIAWRRRGIAALVMRQLLDYTRANHLNRVSLHASEDGRPLYEALGFAPTNEMRLAQPAG